MLHFYTPRTFSFDSMLPGAFWHLHLGIWEHFLKLVNVRVIKRDLKKLRSYLTISFQHVKSGIHNSLSTYSMVIKTFD